jgi:hypothetical protein
VYSYAGLHRLYQKFDRRSIWDQFERRLQEAQEGKAQKRVKAQRGSSFATQW